MLSMLCAGGLGGGGGVKYALCRGVGGRGGGGQVLILYMIVAILKFAMTDKNNA